MIIKLILILGIFIISGLSGHYLGKSRAVEKNILIKEKIVEFKDTNKKINFRALSSVAKPTVKRRKKKAFKENTSYLKEYLDEEDNKELFNKTIRLFSKAKNKGDMALWIALGTTFTNGKEYTTLFNNSLKKLNEDPDQTLSDINAQIKDLTEKDDFLRGMLNNLVNNLEVNKDKKIQFFGEELGRSISINKDGSLKEGSTSIINSMILLKQQVADGQSIKAYLEDALKKNKDGKVKDALRFRLLEYFPDLKNEI